MKNSELSLVNSEQKGLEPFTIHYSLFTNKGFTLVEILVAMAILAIVMSILYSTFSTSSANARIVEEKADELSSLGGAVDTVSLEVRCAYPAYEGSQPVFTGKKDFITFTTLTNLVKNEDPAVQQVTYSFVKDKLIRKTFHGSEKDAKSESVLLEGIEGPKFSFFNGKDWVEEWSSGTKPPGGVKMVFFYRGKSAETVIPLLAGK